MLYLPTYLPKDSQWVYKLIVHHCDHSVNLIATCNRRRLIGVVLPLMETVLAREMIASVVSSNALNDLCLFFVMTQAYSTKCLTLLPDTAVHITRLLPNVNVV